MSSPQTQTDDQPNDDARDIGKIRAAELFANADDDNWLGI